MMLGFSGYLIFGVTTTLRYTACDYDIFSRSDHWVELQQDYQHHSPLCHFVSTPSDLLPCAQGLIRGQLRINAILWEYG